MSNASIVDLLLYLQCQPSKITEALTGWQNSAAIQHVESPSSSETGNVLSQNLNLNHTDVSPVLVLGLDQC